MCSGRFPETPLNTDTRIIQILRRVPLVSVLTGFHCSLDSGAREIQTRARAKSAFHEETRMRRRENAPLASRPLEISRTRVFRPPHYRHPQSYRLPASSYTQPSFLAITSAGDPIFRQHLYSCSSPPDPFLYP